MPSALSAQAVAHSAVTVERVGAKSAVTRLMSRSPLRLLNPSNHGDAAWVFLSSLGGGFVGGDSVALDVRVGSGATCWLSSQASSKAYRASNSRFEVSAALEGDAVLIAWPDPVTCFAGASLEQTQRLVMSEASSVIWVDVLSAGRISRGERWAFSRFASRLFIDVEQRPWLRESTLLSQEHGDLAERLVGIDAVATVTMRGPAFEPWVGPIISRIEQRSPREPALVAASQREGGLLIRATAPSVEEMTSVLHTLLRDPIAACLGDSPFERKW
jgi:urease accessory protein